MIHNINIDIPDDIMNKIILDSIILLKGNIMTAISVIWLLCTSKTSRFHFINIELGYPFLMRVRFDTAKGGNEGAARTSKENAAAIVATCLKKETEAEWNPPNPEEILQLINESDNQVVLWHGEAPTLIVTDEEVRPELVPLQSTDLPPVDGKFCLEKNDKNEEL